MTTSIKGNVPKNELQWRALYDKFQESSSTIKDFADAHGILPNYMSRKFKKIRLADEKPMIVIPRW